MAIPGKRGKMWKLKSLHYGITEAGRHWQKVNEKWLIDEAGFERVFGVSNLFVKRYTEGDIRMIVSKITDDIKMGVTQVR